MMSKFPSQFYFQQEKMGAANEACNAACGMGLREAWSNDRGCYVGHGSSTWMSPSGIARAIAALVFDWRG